MQRKLVRKNMEELLELDLTRQVTPALLAYEGIQYQYMAPQIFYDRTVEVCNRTSADFVWILWCFKTK